MASAASGAAAAALAAALLELERARMRAADLESLVAQRMFTSSQQVPENGRPMTWESAFRMRHNDLIDAHHALRGVRDLLTRNDAQGALEVALAEVGSADSSPEPSESAEQSAPEQQSEEEALDNDPEVPVEVQDMQQQLLEAVQLPTPAAEFVPFSGRCFRLDM